MMKTTLVVILLFFSSCSIKMGHIPIIVKEDFNDKSDTIDFAKIEETRSKGPLQAALSNDCVHFFVLIPTKLTLDIEKVLLNSCPDSRYSFDNQMKHEMFYFLYGRECVVNEVKCVSN